MWCDHPPRLQLLDWPQSLGTSRVRFYCLITSTIMPREVAPTLADLKPASYTPTKQLPLTHHPPKPLVTDGLVYYTRENGTSPKEIYLDSTSTLSPSSALTFSAFLFVTTEKFFVLLFKGKVAPWALDLTLHVSPIALLHPEYSLEGLMLKLKLQYSGHLIWRADSMEKTDAVGDWGQEEKGTTEDEMAGWHHWLSGHGFRWTLGIGDGQGGLACCGSWGHRELDMTEQLNWNWSTLLLFFFCIICFSVSVGSFSIVYNMLLLILSLKSHTNFVLTLLLLLGITSFLRRSLY